MPSSPVIQGFHFCLESDNFDEDDIRLKNAAIPIDTEPHPASQREQKEENWRRVVFIGPGGERIGFNGE
jgi:lactoylglutathione lyase